MKRVWTIDQLGPEKTGAKKKNLFPQQQQQWNSKIKLCHLEIINGNENYINGRKKNVECVCVCDKHLTKKHNDNDYHYNVVAVIINKNYKMKTAIPNSS